MQFLGADLVQERFKVLGSQNDKEASSDLVVQGSKADDRPKKKPRRDNGEGGLSWSEADQRWIGSVELPPDPATGKRRRRRVTDRDEQKALIKLQKVRAEVAAGVVQVTDKSTVKAWLIRWLEEIRKPHLATSTYANYKNVVYNQLIPTIGGIKLQALTMNDVRMMNTKIFRRSKTKNPRTANLSHTVLNKALNDAMAEGLLMTNVASLVPRLKLNPKFGGAFTWDEAMKLLSSCLEREDRMTTRFAAALMTGSRQGEILGLEWDRVDLVNGTIDLSWQLQRIPQLHGCATDDDGDPVCEKKYAAYCPKRVFDIPPGHEYRVVTGSLCLIRPKSKTSRRMIPMIPDLLETLKFHRVQTAYDPNPYGLVWTQPNGNPITARQDWQAWADALKAAGLEHKGTHAARHTTATLLLEKDVEIHIIQEILGHSAALTTGGYAHVDKALARASLGNLAGILGTRAA